MGMRIVNNVWGFTDGTTFDFDPGDITINNDLHDCVRLTKFGDGNDWDCTEPYYYMCMVSNVKISSKQAYRSTSP